MQENRPDPQEQIPKGSTLSTILRRFFPLYCFLAAAATFGYALYDKFQLDGDAIAYMDIGDNLRAHHWAGVVNGYWHPMYPAFLSVGHILFRSTLANELHAYYFVNFVIFLLEMLAVVCFVDSIARLRETMDPPVSTENRNRRGSFLLDRTALRYFGLAILVTASQRELSLGKVRPDALLQAFLLFALAALLRNFATKRMRYAALMGLALGCAYLTKSFAFVFALVCILALVVFQSMWLKTKPTRVIATAVVSCLCFSIFAGPYVAALSHQKGRLSFGDSGSLNYAWYVGGTEKMHLQPYQVSQFGSAEVHLKHPEREILHSPLVLSYAEMPYGTYPDWFDTTYWNDQIKTHFNLRGEISRGSRNLVLVGRYLFNHPEALVLLALLLVMGARLNLSWRPGVNAFWLVPVLLGIVIWGMYGIVNIEERYVTVGYFCVIFALFATLSIPPGNRAHSVQLTSISAALVFFLALLSIGESGRVVFEMRRQLPQEHREGWYNPEVFQAAQALRDLGVRPGDSVACIGFRACMDNQYIERLDGARVLVEVYVPDTPVDVFLAQLQNRAQTIDIVRAQGAKILIGDFERSGIPQDNPVLANWRQLDHTTFYALPLN